MIGQPPGWSRHEHGARIILVPPRASSGVIKYDERRFPLASAPQILDKQLALHVGFRVDRLGTWEQSTTMEGEYAACITVHGTVDGIPAQSDYGIVFLDDAYALISSYCIAEEEFATFTSNVRELTYGDCHFLGVRRRRYDYTPPPGWVARTRGFVTDWSPSAERAIITMFPAMPRRVLPASAVIDSVGPAVREEYAIGALTGERLAIEREGARRTLIVVEDDLYTYVMCLDATMDSHEVAFEAVVHSVRPFLRPARRPNPVLASHWVE